MYLNEVAQMLKVDLDSKTNRLNLIYVTEALYSRGVTVIKTLKSKYNKFRMQ